MATFTDVYKQELKSKGILNSLGSAAFKRTKERLDPRNMLFGGSGMLAASGQKIFGKGYQSLDKTPGKKLSESGTFNGEIKSEVLNSLLASSQNQEAQLSIIAKNTMNGNAMARDMNVMRQNIMKLVTMGGGKASRGSDMFFRDAAAREKTYESQFGKEKTKTSPTPVNKPGESNDGNKGIIGALLGIGSTIASAVTGALGSIPSLLSSIFSAENIAKMLGIGLDVMKGLGSVFRLLLPIITNPLFIGLAAGLIGAKWLMDLIDKGNDEANTDDKKNVRVAQDRGSNSSKLAARTLLIDQGLKSLLDKDRTDADVSDYTRGEIKTKKELAEAISSAQASGKNAIEIKQSRVAEEMQLKLESEALKSMDDGSYANAESKRLSAKPTSPTPAPAGAFRGQRSGDSASPTKVSPGEGGVSEELVNFIKKKEKFSAKAFEDHKQISIGYGTKANSPDEVITEAEADARLRKYLEKAQKDVVSYGKNKGYDWNQNQIEALTSFVYNLGPGALRQVTADGKRSNQQIAEKIPEYNKASDKVSKGLMMRRNEELAMFSLPSPTTGTALASGSTAASDMKMALLTQQQSAPVVINQQSAPPQTQSAPPTAVASAYNLDPWADLWGTSILNPGRMGA